MCVVDYTIGFQALTCFYVQSYGLQEHTCMLAQNGCRAIELWRCGGIFHREANGMDTTGAGVLAYKIHLACLDMWILIDLLKR
jgi:hypothetical protein